MKPLNDIEEDCLVSGCRCKEIEALSRSKAEFWIHRILAEKTVQMIALAHDISLLNYQAQNFSKMGDTIQDNVLDELNREFAKLKWKYKFNK